LRNGNVDPEESSYGLDVIERNVRVQTKLIEDLLDVSRITSGKLQLQLRPTSLSAVIRAAIDSVRPAADSKGIAVQFEPTEGESDSISGDADRLQQVVWNLLSNAIKFTPPGGVVMVRTHRDDAHVAIRITDSGKGIAREFLPYIFDRFRQADSSSTRAHGGLGIGLTIVRHLVELHGGTVEAQSPGEGRGATFIVRIPVASAKTATETGADAPPHPASRARTREAASGAQRENEQVSLDGLRILVVDDEPDARELLHEILRRQGAVVTTAASTQEAMGLFESTRPDVLVSDIGMPVEDGYALIRRVRQRPAEQGGAIPAIALTAYAREEDRKKALAAGFHAHLAKPLEPSEFVRRVSQLLAAQPAPANLP
jgi:CheY-like chemotaxis protein/two-component sensor histidine kinase